MHAAADSTETLPRDTPRAQNDGPPAVEHASGCVLEPAFCAPLYRSFCSSVGSQVGSHSLRTSTDGYGRLRTESRCGPDGMDGCGLLWTTCVHLRIRRLGIRVPPGVLLTRASAQTSSAQTARETARSSTAVGRHLAKAKQGSTFPVSCLHAPTTHPRRTHGPSFRAIRAPDPRPVALQQARLAS
jgi:hypothetical protein